MDGLGKSKIIFFSPYSGIWKHSLSEFQLARQLDQTKFDISIVNCGGVLNMHCAVMESYRLSVSDLDKKKEKICRKCIKCSAELNRFPFTNRYTISEYISRSDIAEIKSKIDSLRVTDFAKFTTEGFEIGRLTAYETLIKFKKTSLELSQVEFDYWKTSVYQGLVVLKSARQILQQETPDICLIYSPQYSAGSVFAEIAEEMGVSTYFLEGSSNIAERYTSLRVWSWSKHRLVNPVLNLGARVPFPKPEEIRRVDNHFKEITKSTSFSVYSPKPTYKFNPRNHYRVRQSQKVLLAALSSYDEAFSAYVIGAFPESKYKGVVFQNQFEWIAETIEWFRKNDQFFLIIRLHPRDFPNKRDLIVSEQSVIWSNLLKNLPSNVGVDYPSNGIALHDYFSNIDAFTTGWSSTALEAMYFGIPVITYDSGMPSYPQSIHYSGNNRFEYFHNLEKALSSGGSVSIQENVISWLAFNFATGTIRITGGISDWTKVDTVSKKNFILRVASILFPRTIHKVEILKSLKNIKEPDRDRLNRLLVNRQSSLFH